MGGQWLWGSGEPAGLFKGGPAHNAQAASGTLLSLFPKGTVRALAVAVHCQVCSIGPAEAEACHELYASSCSGFAGSSSQPHL